MEKNTCIFNFLNIFISQINFNSITFNMFVYFNILFMLIFTMSTRIYSNKKNFFHILKSLSYRAEKFRNLLV